MHGAVSRGGEPALFVDGKDAFIERMCDFARRAFARAEPVRYTIGEPEHQGANYVRNRRIHWKASR